MRLQCAECGYRLLPEQQRCPECGSERSPLTVVDAGSAEDLAWHRGWPGLTALAAVVAIGGFGGISILLSGRRVVLGWVVTGIAALFGAALVAELRRRLVRSDAPRGVVALDDEHLWLDIEATPLCAVDVIELAATGRPDRWKLELHCRPLAAVLPADEAARRWEKLDDVELAGEGGPASLVLAGDEAEARAFVVELEQRVESARRERVPIDDELIGALLDPAGSGVLTLPAHASHAKSAAISADDARLEVRTGQRSRRVGWHRVSEIQLYADEPAAPGDHAPWRWSITITRRSYRLLGLRYDPRPIRASIVHHDPRRARALGRPRGAARGRGVAVLRDRRTTSRLDRNWLATSLVVEADGVSGQATLRPPSTTSTKWRCHEQETAMTSSKDRGMTHQQRTGNPERSRRLNAMNGWDLTELAFEVQSRYSIVVRPNGDGYIGFVSEIGRQFCCHDRSREDCFRAVEKLAEALVLHALSQGFDPPDAYADEHASAA